MGESTRVIRAYVEHFVPRDVVGPVLIVFSLEGVIDGLFSLYVPEVYDTLGWGLIFVASLAVVGYWGSTDEEAVADLQDRLEDIQAEPDEGEAAAAEATAGESAEAADQSVNEES
ncbi:MAG: hypothetical protein ABEJ71_00460 [Halodesulfurarchaeum sp.]